MGMVSNLYPSYKRFTTNHMFHIIQEDQDQIILSPTTTSMLQILDTIFPRRNVLLVSNVSVSCFVIKLEPGVIQGGSHRSAEKAERTTCAMHEPGTWKVRSLLS